MPAAALIGIDIGTTAVKAVLVALVILATANLFVDVRVEHPVAMLAFLVLVACAFSLFGFALGLWFFLSTEQAAVGFFVTPQGAAGLATLRADMSAFFLVGAAFALHSAITSRGAGLLVPGALYAVAITGRAVNLLVAGSYDGAAIPMIVEAVLVLLCWFGWKTLRRT